MDQAIIDFLIGLIQNYPWFSAVLMVMGIARAVFKPLIAVWAAVVAVTPSPADDAGPENFKKGKLYFIIDYILSIKIPSVKP